MKRHIVMVGTLGLMTVAGAFVPGASAESRKCPRSLPVRFPDAPMVVYVLDGKAADSTVLGTVDRDSIIHLEVVCWDELHRRLGLEARNTGIIVYTAPGTRAILRTALDSLASAQRSYVAAHGAFAGSAADLGWSDTTGLISIDLEVSADGSSWSGIGRHRYLEGEANVIRVSGERARRPESMRPRAAAIGSLPTRADRGTRAAYGPRVHRR